MKGIILGTLVFLGSVWGTAYAINLLPDYHWALLPILVTGLMGMFSGIVIFIIWEDK